MVDGNGTRVFSIKVRGADLVAPCPETEKLLIALEQATPFPRPKAVSVGCRKGGCGACRIRVISGEYTTIKMSRAHVTEAEEAEGYVLACRVFPASDMEIEPAFISPKERVEMRKASLN
ncbi:MAG: 2Fe-2S iron-sulfur cluster binding domain-containing protein [Maritimibacter sp.]|nr:2Fe-2S iron-sulfur cluster binding domain-containing protein [Maritimibacter sp.]